MVVASEPHRVSTDEDSKKVELLSEEDMDGGEGRGRSPPSKRGGKAARNTNQRTVDQRGFRATKAKSLI